MAGTLKILIVDDMTRARQSMRALLSTWGQGQVVREAVSGFEAITQVAEWMPDLVLMDVRMAGMNGLEATRRIKANWPRVKVIVLSMYDEYKTDALAAGADAFITKGDPPEVLLATLTDLVNRGQQMNP